MNTQKTHFNKERKGKKKGLCRGFSNNINGFVFHTYTFDWGNEHQAEPFQLKKMQQIMFPYTDKSVTLVIKLKTNLKQRCFHTDL